MSGVAGALARAAAARCLLVPSEQRLPRGVGFRRMVDGMGTLAVVATLDGWTDTMQRLQVSHATRAPGYLEAAAEGLRAWLEAPEPADRVEGLRYAAVVLAGCASAAELESLRAKGVLYCGEDSVGSGVPAICPATCVAPQVATVILVIFVVLAQVVPALSLPRYPSPPPNAMQPSLPPPRFFSHVCPDLSFARRLEAALADALYDA
jgi:hypothetical protein